MAHWIRLSTVGRWSKVQIPKLFNGRYFASWMKFTQRTAGLYDLKITVKYKKVSTVFWYKIYLFVRCIVIHNFNLYYKWGKQFAHFHKVLCLFVLHVWAPRTVEPHTDVIPERNDDVVFPTPFYLRDSPLW